MSDIGLYPYSKYSKSKRQAAAINLVFDRSLGYKRLVCATCRVPFSLVDSRIDVGTDELGLIIVICRDCQRQVPDEDDDPWADPGWGQF